MYHDEGADECQGAGDQYSGDWDRCEGVTVEPGGTQTDKEFWLPTFFKISSFVFHRRKNLTQVWK